MSEPARPVPGNPNAARIREINDTIRYAMWSVFAVAEPIGDEDRDALAAEVEELFTDLAAKDVIVRGTYDVAGLRADADVMVWWHAETIEALQEAYHALLRTAYGQHLDPVWSVAALHRPAEFNKSHIPAFMADEEARDYVCVYPFVRSYDWYLLEDAERRDLLREHGQMARDYPDVRANTIASFALNDYEWILAFEAASSTSCESCGPPGPGCTCARRCRSTRGRAWTCAPWWPASADPQPCPAPQPRIPAPDFSSPWGKPEVRKASLPRRTSGFPCQGSGRSGRLGHRAPNLRNGRSGVLEIGPGDPHHEVAQGAQPILATLLIPQHLFVSFGVLHPPVELDDDLVPLDDEVHPGEHVPVAVTDRHLRHQRDAVRHEFDAAPGLTHGLRPAVDEGEHGPDT